MKVTSLNGDSVKARNLRNRVPTEDLLSIDGIPCTMRVHVSNAFIQNEYDNNKRPYMRLIGYVDSVFIEDDDNRLFPNQTKDIPLSDDGRQQVFVDYQFDDAELGKLATKGLFHKGFRAADILINNVIEIPCKIKYEAVMYSPVSFITIENPYSIKTNTVESGYTMLVDMFAPYSSYTTEEMLDGDFLEDDVYDEDTYDMEDDAEYNSHMESQFDQPQNEVVTTEDEEAELISELQANIYRRYEAQVQADMLEKQQKNDDAADDAQATVEKLLSEDDDLYDDENESESEFDEILDGNETDTRDSKNSKKRRKADFQRIKQRVIRQDAAHDNVLVNSGIDDITSSGVADVTREKSKEKTRETLDAPVTQQPSNEQQYF